MTEAGYKLDIPDFLNKKFLEKCIENGLEMNCVEVVHFHVTPGSDPGENYTSTLYRTKVMYNQPLSRGNTIHFIIKSIPIDEALASMEKYGFVDKEICVYQKLLPKLQTLLETNETNPVAPKCYEILRIPHRILVLQDMKAFGYSGADRVIGLDEGHLEVVLKKIAKFHAASMIVLSKNPAIEGNFCSGFFTEETVTDPLYEASFKAHLKLGATMLLGIPGYERFSPKLMKLHDNFADIILNVVKANYEDDIKVLNHGDLWVNNFLFKYDDKTKKPRDVVFVDYQGSHFNSLGIDINYLFSTSAQPNVLQQRMELIEKYYYPSFTETIKLFNFQPIPSLQDITTQIERRDMFFVICLFGLLPLHSMNKEESKTNDLTHFADKDLAERKSLVGMSSRRFMESMKYTLNVMEKTIDDIISKY